MHAVIRNVLIIVLIICLILSMIFTKVLKDVTKKTNLNIQDLSLITYFFFEFGYMFSFVIFLLLCFILNYK